MRLTIVPAILAKDFKDFKEKFKFLEKNFQLIQGDTIYEGNSYRKNENLKIKS